MVRAHDQVAGVVKKPLSQSSSNADVGRSGVQVAVHAVLVAHEERGGLARDDTGTFTPRPPLTRSEEA